MALIQSAATGNFNAGATWVGGIVPTVGDEARASTGHGINITANATCTEVSNDGTGMFTLNDGITLTANVTNKSTLTSRACLQFAAISPAVGTIVGNVTSGPATSTLGINNVNTGTLSITGNVTGGSAGSAYGVYNSSTGTLSITGNATGGSATNAFGVQGQGNGAITITGNATGSAFALGVNNVGAGTITINGIATGGNNTVGVNNGSTGTINLGRAKGNAYGPGNTSGLVAAAGAANVGLGIIEIKELEYGTFGMSPITGTGIRLKKVGTNVVVFNYCDTAGAKNLIDATTNASMPAASDVRSGVSYASGASTGSCAVPAAGSVALGVPVDATLGTAVLTAAAIRVELATELGRIDAAVSSRLAPSGTLATVTTLTNAPASVTPAQIRQELDTNSTKLANLDTTVSSRLASSVSTNITAIKAKTDLLNTDRLGQVATTSIVGNLIAQSNS